LRAKKAKEPLFLGLPPPKELMSQKANLAAINQCFSKEEFQNNNSRFLLLGLFFVEFG
jgi:hypothetical protein